MARTTPAAWCLAHCARWPAVARAALLVCLGVLAGFGQAPYGIWPITLITLAIWLVLLPMTLRPFRHGWLFGLGYFAHALSWIVEPFLVDADRYGWMAPFALILMAGGAALFWGFAAWLGRGSVAFTAVVLIGVEALRSLILTGFPWALLGHIWIDEPLGQLAAFAGPHSLGLVTAALALSLVWLMHLRWTGVIAPLLCGPLWLLLAPPPVVPSLEAPMVRIVQPNVPQNEKWDLERRAYHFERKLAMTGGAEPRPDLIVWPETAVSQLMEYAQPAFDDIAEAARGVPLITGVQRRRIDEIYHNSAVMVGLGGEIGPIYDKHHLVPFGEYFPGGELAARAGLIGFASSQGFGFTKGDEPALVKIPGIGDARVLICYEGIFAEEITVAGQRPRLMIMITNDAWFGTRIGPFQHFAQARLRAIEQGVPMVRVANTGISAMIDAYGRVTAQIPLGQAAARDVALPDSRPSTLYARTGDWPVLILLTVLVLSLFLSGRADFH